MVLAAFRIIRSYMAVNGAASARSRPHQSGPPARLGSGGRPPALGDARHGAARWALMCLRARAAPEVVLL
jgi:hypothetical protein